MTQRIGPSSTQHVERPAGRERDAEAGDGIDIREVVSHELRTPLTVVKVGVDLLDRDLDPPMIESVLDAMRRAVRRLEDVVAAAEAAADMVNVSGGEDPGCVDPAMLCVALGVVGRSLDRSGFPVDDRGGALPPPSADRRARSVLSATRKFQTLGLTISCG